MSGPLSATLFPLCIGHEQLCLQWMESGQPGLTLAPVLPPVVEEPSNKRGHAQTQHLRDQELSAQDQ